MSVQRIMLVDDDPHIRRIAEISLTAVGGFDVTLVHSGMEAVSAAKRSRPDLILLDVMMPEMDGPTTLQLLRADPQTAAIPVVFMTAKVQRREVERYRNLGALGTIAKPFDPMTLPDEVRRFDTMMVPRTNTAPEGDETLRYTPPSPDLDPTRTIATSEESIPCETTQIGRRSGRYEKGLCS